jgi:hypothetical protein
MRKAIGKTVRYGKKNRRIKRFEADKKIRVVLQLRRMVRIRAAPSGLPDRNMKQSALQALGLHGRASAKKRRG